MTQHLHDSASHYDFSYDLARRHSEFLVREMFHDFASICFSYDLVRHRSESLVREMFHDSAPASFCLSYDLARCHSESVVTLRDVIS